MALAILREEVEHEAWFYEYLSEGPCGARWWIARGAIFNLTAALAESK
jgi:hypothetical protein